MAARRITIKVLGAEEDRGHVRLSEFIRQLDVIRAALRQTERHLAGSDESLVYWRVVDLRHESPATVVLEDVPVRRKGNAQTIPPRVVERFVHDLGEIRAGHAIPRKERDLALLESYRDVAGLVDRNVQTLTITGAKRTVKITPKFKDNLERIIGPDESAQGSISGVLEAINLHNALKFQIYPVVGASRVLCHFAEAQKAQVIAGLDKYVRVTGRVLYKSWSQHPHAVHVDQVEIFPPDDELPTLHSLRGTAPDATSGVPADVFIRERRDAEW